MVYNMLVGINLCDKIKIGVFGKIVMVFDVVCMFVMGVDWCNVVCGFMFVFVIIFFFNKLVIVWYFCFVVWLLLIV